MYNKSKHENSNEQRVYVGTTIGVSGRTVLDVVERVPLIETGLVGED